MSIVNNLGELEQLFKLMKANLIDKVKIGDVEVSITLHTHPDAQTPSKSDFAKLMDEEDEQLTDEDIEELIGWSSGS